MKEILAKIKPTKEEIKNFKSISSTFLTRLNRKLKGSIAIIGGSGAKDTWLAKNHDVDVYVLFDYKQFKDKSLELSDLLERVLKKTFPKQKMKRLHGSRDYFQLKYGGLEFEIVPIVRINNSKQALNITDISPLHAKWVNRKARGIKDEIRLAKYFLRMNKLYGAESYICGFSGYITEILIAHYGSFEKLLKASLKWKIKQIIDVEKHYPKKDVLFNLNKSKTQSPLIIVDPVDKSRNAAAALSLEKFNHFKKLAKKYLKNPNVKYFEREEIDLVKLKLAAAKKKQHLVHLEVVSFTGKEDVVGVKLLKAFNFLENKFDLFEIKKSGWDWNKKKTALFYFLLAKEELSEYEIRNGPPLKLKEFVKDFKKKNKQTYTKKGKLYAKIKRKHPLLKDYLKDCLKNVYFKEKVSKVKKINVYS